MVIVDIEALRNALYKFKTYLLTYKKRRCVNVRYKFYSERVVSTWNKLTRQC